MAGWLTILALVAVVAGGPPATAPFDRAATDRAVEAARHAGLAGEVIVTDASRTLYDVPVSAAGRAHRVGELWRWASVTKQLTATLVMQEVQAGRLSLDDTLAARLPAFRGPTAARVTLRDLLRHTSGLPNPDDTPAADAASMPAFYLRPDAEVGGAADATGYCAGAPKAEPGGHFAYDNCDYIVLGAVLERETGSPFAALVRERLAAPLHLASLRVATGGRAARRLAPGFVDASTPEPPVQLATFGASGAAYGQAADLAGFDRGLLSGRLLDAGARRTAWAGEPRLGYVALGVWGFPAALRGCPGGPVALVERRGEIGGIEVRNLIAPVLGRALVVFADRSDLDFGEIWQGRGLSYDLASAAFCGGPA